MQVSTEQTVYEEALRSAGLRVTRSRISLLKAIHHDPKNIEVLERELMHKMHRATIYRTLTWLEEKNLIHKIDIPKEKSQYEFSTTHHHHIVCIVCGKVEEISSCVLKEVEMAMAKKAKQFTMIEGHRLDFFGTCTNCLQHCSQD